MKLSLIKLNKLIDIIEGNNLGKIGITVMFNLKIIEKT